MVLTIAYLYCNNKNCTKIFDRNTNGLQLMKLYMLQDLEEISSIYICMYIYLTNGLRTELYT